MFFKLCTKRRPLPHQGDGGLETSSCGISWAAATSRRRLSSILIDTQVGRAKTVSNGAGEGLCINRWPETNEAGQAVQSTVSHEAL